MDDDKLICWWKRNYFPYKYITRKKIYKLSSQTLLKECHRLNRFFFILQKRVATRCFRLPRGSTITSDILYMRMLDIWAHIKFKIKAIHIFRLLHARFIDSTHFQMGHFATSLFVVTCCVNLKVVLRGRATVKLTT